MGVKKKSITNKVAESIKNYGKQPGRFTTILQEAIGILRGFMERFKNFGDFKIDRDGNVIASKKLKLDITPEALPPREKGPYPNDISEKNEIRRLGGIYEKLKKKNNQIFAIEKDIEKLKSELAEIKPYMFWLKGKKDELTATITVKEIKIEKLNSDIQLIPKMYGFTSVADLNRAYSRAKNKLEDVRKRQREWNTSDPKPDQRITYVVPEILIEDPDKKEKVKDRSEERPEVKEPQPRSIKDRLKENQKQVDEQKRTKRKRTVDRDSR